MASWLNPSVSNSVHSTHKLSESRKNQRSKRSIDRLALTFPSSPSQYGEVDSGEILSLRNACSTLCRISSQLPPRHNTDSSFSVVATPIAHNTDDKKAQKAFLFLSLSPTPLNLVPQFRHTVCKKESSHSTRSMRTSLCSYTSPSQCNSKEKES